MDKVIVKPLQLTKRTIKDLNKIKSFNKELIGEEKAEEIIDILFNCMSILEGKDVDLINIGSIDIAFEHLKHAYRKLIQNNYKITYRVGKTKIYIVRVFDTRQHPNKNR